MHSLIVPLDSAQAADASRFGSKAANLAALGQAGLRIPGGFCIDAEAYRIQVWALGLHADARAVLAVTESADARRHALHMRLGLLEGEVVPEMLAPLLASWRVLQRQHRASGVVRSSALVEDRASSSFAGQFDSYLGLESEADYLTAVRACWAALWSTRALRYMAVHALDPADTAMAVLVQPLVPALAAGGGLSRTAEGDMVVNAAPGLGVAIAQGEVVPDRYVLSRAGAMRDRQPGLNYHRLGCAHGASRLTRLLRQTHTALCLAAAQVEELGAMMRRAEEVLGGPVEIEWALDAQGPVLLQARPLHVQASPKGTDATEAMEAAEALWQHHPRLQGHPAGAGWGTGRARVVNCECELSQVAPGEVLITRVAGPALSAILPRLAGVVAELGGSTSHLASLARERSLPMVLGVADATERIPNGAMVAVDGVAGIVRWMH